MTIDKIDKELYENNLKDRSSAQNESFDRDNLEIGCKNLPLQKILDKGAFGQVKRVLYQTRTNNLVTVEMAAKFLKHKNILEIINDYEINFLYQEIEMIKSKKQHPNVVNLIGYSTRLRWGLMLLTEHCSHENLLNYLR